MRRPNVASRYLLPHGLRRALGGLSSELKLLVRVWLNLLLPLRLLRYLRLTRQTGIRLHLGCGSNRFPEWVNVDMGRKGDLTVDLREGLPFRDDSVEAIFTEHALEHFYREHDLPLLLGEALRVLRPGGRLRVAVPDGAVALRYYHGSLEPPERAERFGQLHRRFHGTPMDVVNSAFRWKHQHLYMYDEETLGALLREVGFVAVEARAFRDSPDPALREVDNEERAFETLYMEGVAPGA